MDISKIKPGLNPGMIIGFIINISLIIFLFNIEKVGWALIGFLFCVLNIIGLILSLTLSNLAGPYLVIIGNIFFVPIGLIGIIGAIQAINNRKKAVLMAIENELPLEEDSKWERLTDDLQE